MIDQAIAFVGRFVVEECQRLLDFGEPACRIEIGTTQELFVSADIRGKDFQLVHLGKCQIVDEVGEPVRTPYGYHLIKVSEREIPAPPTLEEARDKIIAFLKQDKCSKLLEEWVGLLRQGAEITIHDN